MIKAALFDMDGTLVDSIQDLAEATNYAISKHGFAEKPLENYRYYVGNGVYKLIERAIAPNTVSADELKTIRDDFFDYYCEHYTVKTTVYDGVAELIVKLKSAGISVGCITNKVDVAAQGIIKFYFGNMDIVYGQLDGIPHKPDPYLPQKAMEKLGVNPHECLFIGDSDVDMLTAQNCGAISVGVEWGFRTKEELIKSGANYTVTAPDEILEIIKKYE